MLKNRIEMRDHSAEGRLFFRRTLVAYIGMVVLMLVLLGNLYYLQVESYETYQTRSNDNRIRVVPVAPPRGLIYDANGVLLAENRPVYSLEIVPEETKDLEKTADELITLLALPEGTKERFLAEVKRQRRFKPVPLFEKLTEYQVALFSVNQHNYPGASIEAYLKRYYPFGDTLTHALGYVAKINTRDVERLDKEDKLANYAATKDIGKQGVEKFYEDQLHGVAGYQEVEVNNRGRVVRTLKFQPPTPGKDDPAPAHSGKVVDFVAARDEAAKEEKKAVKQKPPTEKDKAAKPGRGRPSKDGKAAPDKTKPSKPRDKKSQSKPAPENPAVDKGGAPAGAEVTPEPSAPRDATRAEKEEIVYLNLSDLHPFKNHPFGVRDDAEMQGLVESVKAAGVNQPALVRPREDGGYEIIAGHRRQRASELAGFANMPCIVRNMTDDEAILAMTDDNLRHRERILPTEKAQSLKMQVEAIKHQGRTTSSQVGGKTSCQLGTKLKM